MMNYMRIDKCDIANGTGVRVVLWMSGCHHHCEGCHNPEAQGFNAGTEITAEIADELMDALKPSYIRGITFSGGDPLAPENIPRFINLSCMIRSRFGDTKDIWVYTGYTYEELSERQLSWVHKYADILVDGRYIEALRDVSLRFRGSSNQRLIDIKKTIEKGEVVLYES